MITVSEIFVVDISKRRAVKVKTICRYHIEINHNHPPTRHKALEFT